MAQDDPALVVPSQPGLHLLVDEPQGPSAPLLQRIAAHGLDQGIPVICVLVDEAAPQFRSGLQRHGVDAETAEGSGMLAYVDAHAHRVGWAHTTPATIFVESEGPDAILLAISEAQAGMVERSAKHMVLVSSVSSLLLLEGLNAAYRFGQALSSMAPRMGSITVGRVIQGMHASEELTSLRHLATTVTDLSRSAGASQGEQPQGSDAGSSRARDR